jgi:cell division protein FtsN
MSRDYKTAPKKSASGSGFSAGAFLLGLLVGLLLGLGIALAVAWYVNKMPSPFVSRVPPKGEAKGGPPDTAKGGGEEKPPAKAADGKPRFEFYDILPGAKEPGAEPKDATGKGSTPAVKETFYLQAGAFQNAQDADNLKARLALLSYEASVQAASVPEKGTWYRVRLGPYASVEDLTRARDALKQNGIDTTLVKVRDAGDTKPGK